MEPDRLRFYPNYGQVYQLLLRTRKKDKTEDVNVGKGVYVGVRNIRSIYGHLNELTSECISVDCAVNIREARNAIREKKLMGNISTILLQNGPIDNIQKVSRNLLDLGIDILAPACGLSAKTPVKHIRAMTGVAKGK